MKTPCSQHESWYAQTLKALAKQEQGDPVAWIHCHGNFEEAYDRPLDEDEVLRGWTQIPLYTTPRQRTWVGLNWSDLPEEWVGNPAFMEGAKWAEAKLKGKNI
jgi:hypothetical protein